MTTALELLQKRRSVKPAELVAPAPTPEQIETLLTIASRVPDHGKLTPWRFIIIDGAARDAAGTIVRDVFKSKNEDADDARLEIERTRFSRAPLVIAVVSAAAPHVKIPEWEQVLSAGAATMNLVTAAHALGFAANWITEWYGYDEEVLKRFGLKPGERIAGFVHIGTAARPPEDRPRPALADIVTHFKA
ncbi:putative NAD(P)H nitroreductase YdjA [Variibacter gotjawalensis]|uniref:Putative NAD(P)H nitroreductase n=1 Tax=Variibacter gotjawalensis TaxID=1333996 RepID=A0A0S3PW58_9BRAD|nr:nitroreductase [Variibacter gotjawalensis]NIK45994.1 nitroreductase [Variibacter gotjawalensis]RZS47912.1 nitroreductase [Variibacter gotjawalensis]BAT60168.1 putative NAD(P)H nitroreductase YdjA [Variibacter gotjawalensis]